jgi:hypothetical protein
MRFGLVKNRCLFPDSWLFLHSCWLSWLDSISSSSRSRYNNIYEKNLINKNNFLHIYNIGTKWWVTHPENCHLFFKRVLNQQMFQNPWIRLSCDVIATAGLATSLTSSTKKHGNCTQPRGLSTTPSSASGKMRVRQPTKIAEKATWSLTMQSL